MLSIVFPESLWSYLWFFSDTDLNVDILQGLDNILDDLVTMEMLVYSCHVDESLTFKQLQEMADYDKLELIMSKVSNHLSWCPQTNYIFAILFYY